MSSQNRSIGIGGLRMGGELVESRCGSLSRLMHFGPEVIRERVQDGLTGETREMQYTQCKIVGNGSFGVVFQTKLAPSNEDAAIKRVLQDKRFKASSGLQECAPICEADQIRTGSCRLCASYAIPISSN